MWLLAAGLVGGIGVLAGQLVNTNLFSLHGLYRNRLIRAYLGATRGVGERPRGRRNLFTDFDPADNVSMPGCARARTIPAETGRRGASCPSTSSISRSTWSRGGAWPGRSARPPLHDLAAAHGHLLPGPTRRASDRLPVHLRLTGDKPMRREAGEGVRHGISLGSAMAISGAAASPNMGYHSSPLVALRDGVLQRPARLVAREPGAGPIRRPVPQRRAGSAGRAGGARSDRRSEAVRVPVRRRTLRQPGYLRDGPSALPRDRRGRRDGGRELRLQRPRQRAPQDPDRPRSPRHDRPDRAPPARDGCPGGQRPLLRRRPHPLSRSRPARPRRLARVHPRDLPRQRRRATRRPAVSPREPGLPERLDP